MKCKKCGASRSWFEWLIGYPCECEIETKYFRAMEKTNGKKSKA